MSSFLRTALKFGFRIARIESGIKKMSRVSSVSLRLIIGRGFSKKVICVLFSSQSVFIIALNCWLTRSHILELILLSSLDKNVLYDSIKNFDTASSFSLFSPSYGLLYAFLKFETKLIFSSPGMASWHSKSYLQKMLAEKIPGKVLSIAFNDHRCTGWPSTSKSECSWNGTKYL